MAVFLFRTVSMNIWKIPSRLCIVVGVSGVLEPNGCNRAGARTRFIAATVSVFALRTAVIVTTTVIIIIVIGCVCALFLRR